MPRYALAPLLFSVWGCYAVHERPCPPGEACDCRAVDRVPPGVTVVGFGEGACDPASPASDAPVHLETLTREVWLGRYEATGACYARCVTEGACAHVSASFVQMDAAEGGRDWDERWYLDPELGMYPMVPLTWDNAAAYCAWLGGRLPTNAEWERAVRADDGRRYPWGDERPTECDVVSWLGPETRCPENFDSWMDPVDSYPRGRGVYGHYHLADNACEWVQDWYGCYPAEAVIDWSGPESSPIGERTKRCLEYREPDPSDLEVYSPRSVVPNSVRCAFDTQPAPLRPGDSVR